MTGKAVAEFKPISGECREAQSLLGQAFTAAINSIFLSQQNEEHVRGRIKRGDFRYAVKLMRAWFFRKQEDIEVLRSLKAYLLQRRVEVRAVKAGYARTFRKNRRAKRAASDMRVCAVCGQPMKHKRAKAAVCSPKCRVQKHRNRRRQCWTGPGSEASA